MKIFLINDTSDSHNWGCRATTRALRRMITAGGGRITHALGVIRMMKEERFVPSMGGRVFERTAFGVTSRLPLGRRTATAVATRALHGRVGRLYGAGDTVPESLDQFPIFARYILEGLIYRDEREALEACDAVVINGEGSIYDRQRKGRMMLFLAYLAKRYFNKPCILVNHTADLHDPIMAEMAAAVYPLLDDVVFREPISAEQCRSILPDAAARFAPDAAFSYRPAERSAWSEMTARTGYFSVWPDDADSFEPARPYVCVGASSIYLRPDRPAYDPLPAYIALCCRLRKEFGQVVLTAPCETDQTIMRHVARDLGFPLIGLNTPTQQVVDILGNATLYISGRWHPSILALTGGTPVVVMTANTHKTAGLLRLIGLDAPVFDALRLEHQTDEVVRLAQHYVAQGDSLRDRLRNRAGDLSVAVQRNVAWLQSAGGTPSTPPLVAAGSYGQAIESAAR
jgi:polysaccharide pyruvyl transferase WcaK-like protein